MKLYSDKPYDGYYSSYNHEYAYYETSGPELSIDGDTVVYFEP